MSCRPQRYVRDLHALDEARAQAKLTACPHCGRVGTLIGHGKLVGYEERSSARVVRGQRLFCSNRRRRPGCGHTLSVLLSTTIKHFIARTPTLSRMLERVAMGSSPKAAWEHDAIGAPLRTGHRLWRRLALAQSHLRSTLSERCSAPACDDANPLVQTLAHLRAAIGKTDCVLASFQVTFQRCVFG